MGRRGPAPKPVELRILEGNPGKRRLNDQRPKPTPTAPACPAWLPDEARAEWARVLPELERLGLITLVDAAALAGYCLAWAQLRQAQGILEEHGLTMTTASGYEQQRPEVSIVHKCLGLIKSFSAEFGFTPSARGRMTVAPQADEDDDLLD
jgi:P27 family predicted phage terminase small subunit